MAIDIRIALFLHIVSAIGVFAVLGIELLAGHVLVRTNDARVVCSWAHAVLTVDRIGSLALVGLLFTGPHLGGRMGFFEGAGVQGWIAVGILAVVALGGLGAMVHRRAFRAIHRAAEAADGGPLDEPTRAALAAPAAWVSLNASVAMTLGVVWLMSNKPAGMAASLAIVVGAAALGAVVGRGIAGLAAARLTAVPANA